MFGLISISPELEETFRKIDEFNERFLKRCEEIDKAQMELKKATVKVSE